MKVAVITGAASGIGLALSVVCLQRGMKVVLVDKDQPKLKSEAELLLMQYPNRVLDFTCDITQTSEVEQLSQRIYEQIDHIDWLFNNAGIIGSLAPIWELTTEQVDQVMNVNLYGMHRMIRAFMPFLARQESGHIINIASLYALCSGSQVAAYSMSKHAVLALSESLHFDLARIQSPIKVSVVFPSFTDTALLSTKTSDIPNTFHESLNALLSHSRPAPEVAEHIVQEVEKNRFYILPDKEVKAYGEERTRAVIMQEDPHINNVEKIMSSLMKRKRALK